MRRGSKTGGRPAGGRARLQEALRARERQQGAVARLGHQALAGIDLVGLFDLAVREVGETLEVQHVGLCQLHADGRFSFNAGIGWDPGIVGATGMPYEPGSQADFMLRNQGPVVTHDVAAEKRFPVSPIVTGHGVVSSMTVIVPGRARPWGILGAHSTTRRTFTQDDINFLDSVAQVLASAVERSDYEEELQRSRLHLEETVAERTRELAASNRELEAFSYSVSHDLRAPLRTIAGYSALLATRHAQELTPEARELVDGVRKGTDRLSSLINDLLDLSRVQRLELRREALDLSGLFAQGLAALAKADGARSVSWTVTPGLVAHGDPRLLGVLVDNLAGNAWKFTRRTPRATIVVGRQDGERTKVFFVRDNGAGFDMAYASKLFQPFQRLHRASEFEGTGIGLATVKRIVERHGGRVWAESRPNAGTTVYFTLGAAT